MPYIKKGNVIYKKVNGKLKKVGSSKEPEKYLRKLRMIEAEEKKRKKK
jgi:hypothetical protein